jgi:hypothetical protein
MYIICPNQVANEFLGQYVNEDKKNFFDKLCYMIWDGEQGEMYNGFPSGH